jgi:hypothetical protein
MTMNKILIETNEGDASVISLNGQVLNRVVSVGQTFESDGLMYATLVLQAEPIELVRNPDEAAVSMQKELDERVVVEAYEQGKIIEWRPKGLKDCWYAARARIWDHTFDFNANEYRLVKR